MNGQETQALAWTLLEITAGFGLLLAIGRIAIVIGLLRTDRRWGRARQEATQRDGYNHQHRRGE